MLLCSKKEKEKQIHYNAGQSQQGRAKWKDVLSDDTCMKSPGHAQVWWENGSLECGGKPDHAAAQRNFLEAAECSKIGFW